MKHKLSSHTITIISLVVQCVVLVMVLALPISIFERLLVVFCILMLIVGHYSHFFDDREVSVAKSHMFWCVVIAALTAGGTNLLIAFTKGEVVLSAAIVGTLLGIIPHNKKSLFDKGVQLSGYAGVFVGMSAPTLFVHWVMAFFAGAIAGLLFATGSYSLHGVGGRLGTFAFLSVVFVLMLQLFFF